MNEELFRLALVQPLTREVYEDLRIERAIEVIKEQQMRELAMILSEQFLDNLSIDYEAANEAEVKDNDIKEVAMPLTPNEVKCFNEILQNFHEQTELKQIKLLTVLSTKINLSKSIRFGSEVDYQKQGSPLEPNKGQIKILPQIIELRNKLRFRIPELLMQHGVSILTYIKNVQNFYLFSSCVLDKVNQLRKAPKSLGSFERFERTIHLGKTWQPNGFLVKTIYEHKDSVNCLDASMNGKLFASAGQDGVIKVFDIGKIES